MDTLNDVREELQARKGYWPAICDATGLKYDWLNKFSRGQIKEPSYNKITKLRHYLSQVPRYEPPQYQPAD